MMKLMDLYVMLGETMADLHTADEKTIKEKIRRANSEEKLSRQIVSIANTMLNAEKLGYTENVDRIFGDGRKVDKR